MACTPWSKYPLLVAGITAALLWLAGCGLPARIQATPGSTTPALVTVINPAPSSLATVEATTAPTITKTKTPLPQPTATSQPTASLTPGPTPTWAVLRGEVLERSNCRYGPGAPYLYKYGLVVGSNLEIIGRNDAGTWILVQAIGGNNPCWVKASLMQVKGDILSVAPTYLPLPLSPYYAPPGGVWASRNGDDVTVSWNAVPFRAGDETASPPYLVEAWVCVDGALQFMPVGSYTTTTIIRDEAGCKEPSHARLYTVEKHGYSLWIKIPWPAPP